MRNRMPGFVMSLFIGMLWTSAACAQMPCATRTYSADTPSALSGQMSDATANIDFRWRSTASANSGWWSIRHSLCNASDTPLVVIWEKAGIKTPASRPIAPHLDVTNGFSIGPVQPSIEPNSPIAYGLRPGRTVQAQTYQPKDTKAASLTSFIVGSIVEVEDVGTVASVKAGAPSLIEFLFEAKGNKDNYEFAVIAKSEAAGKLSIGISSSQNDALLQAFKQAGLDPDVISANKLDATERMDTEFIVVRPRGRALIGLIGIKPERVEIARVVLLTEKLQPVLFGQISLFAP